MEVEIIQFGFHPFGGPADFFGNQSQGATRIILHSDDRIGHHGFPV